MGMRIDDTIAERAARARSARARRLVVRDGLKASRASAARRWSAVLVATTHRPQDRPFLRNGRAPYLVALERVVRSVAP